MAIFPSICLLVSLAWSSAHVCKRVNRTNFSPYGPEMCHEFCQCFDSLSDYDVTGLTCGCKNTYDDISKLEICSNKSDTIDRVIQMRCVMCTEIPGTAVHEHFCQDVQGHIVCSIISNNKSCVLTTKRANKHEDANKSRITKSTKVTRTQQHAGSSVNRKKMTDELQLKPDDILGILLVKKPNCLKSRQTGSRDDQGIIRQGRRCRPDDKYFCSNMEQQAKRFLDPLLNGNESINCRHDVYGAMTPIMRALSCGKPVFDLLLGLGADLSVTLKNSKNLLYIAIRGTWLYPVKVLFELGFDIEMRDPRGRTPFLEAVDSGRLVMMKYLASEGCDINVVTRHKQNALHLACKQGRTKIVKHFLKWNFTFKLNDCDEYGKTPLDYAIRPKLKRMQEIVKLLRAAMKESVI